MPRTAGLLAASAAALALAALLLVVLAPLATATSEIATLLAHDWAQQAATLVSPI